MRRRIAKHNGHALAATSAAPTPTHTHIERDGELRAGGNCALWDVTMHGERAGRRKLHGELDSKRGTISSNGSFTAPGAVGSITITATAQSASGTATISVQLALPSSKHVVLVMEENQEYSTVVGNTADWPNLNELISSGALATNYFADSHPSIGNYFMLTTGQLLTTNDNSTKVFNVDNIARRMLAANASFKVYAEGIKQGYVGGNGNI